MEKEFTLFINLREYERGVKDDGSPALGELTDNFYCLKPENAEMTGDMMFLGYMEENGERVGVRLLCDPGYVNDGDGPLTVNLKVGGKYRFAHTDMIGGGIGRIRGYNLRLYENDGHTHEHAHEHDEECESCTAASCDGCAGCGEKH